MLLINSKRIAMAKHHRIVITPGDPAGIGPDITILAAQKTLAAQLIVAADPDVLLRRAKLLNMPLHLHDWHLDNDTAHQPGHLFIIPIAEKVKSEPGKLNPGNAEYIAETLD